MKRKLSNKITIIMLVISTFLLTLPVINLFHGKVNNLESLYNLDLIYTQLNRLMVSLGISLNSEQVIVGYDKWYFIGNKYDDTRVLSRFSADNQNVKAIAQVMIEAQTAWKKVLLNMGVKDYKIIIGPNKSTIYQDKLPIWLRSPKATMTDALVNSDYEGIYVDPRQNLKSQKRDTYRRTDTHWNKFGAAVAFKQFIEQLAKSDDELKLPESAMYEVKANELVSGGDLTRFLKISQYETDKDYKMSGEKKLIHVFFDKNRSRVDKKEEVIFKKSLILYQIETQQALNNRKVLWLSDSFGTAFANYMTYTFSDVVKVHWSAAIGKPYLYTLIDKYKPDFVVLTVVERALYRSAFKVFPRTQNL